MTSWLVVSVDYRSSPMSTDRTFSVVTEFSWKQDRKQILYHGIIPFTVVITSSFFASLMEYLSSKYRGRNLFNKKEVESVVHQRKPLPEKSIVLAIGFYQTFNHSNIQSFSFLVFRSTTIEHSPVQGTQDTMVCSSKP